MRAVMAELFGKSTGVCRGQGGSMHMFSSEFNVLGGFAFIGEGIPVSTGAAFQTRYRREVLQDEKADQVTCSFFGDGTCNNGAFYECLNMAALYKLPIIFCVENNLWAIGMQHDRATAPTLGDTKPHIYKKGPAFGMPGYLVDGMDVLKASLSSSREQQRAAKGRTKGQNARRERERGRGGGGGGGRRPPGGSCGRACVTGPLRAILCSLLLVSFSAASSRSCAGPGGHAGGRGPRAPRRGPHIARVRDVPVPGPLAGRPR